MLRATRCGQFLECVAVCNKHNHELSEHSASLLFQNRKLPADLRMEVMQLSIMHVDRKRITDYVYRKTGKMMTGKDLQNFRQAALALLQSNDPKGFGRPNDDLLCELNRVCGKIKLPDDIKYEVVEVDQLELDEQMITAEVLDNGAAETIQTFDDEAAAFGFEDAEYIQDEYILADSGEHQLEEEEQPPVMMPENRQDDIILTETGPATYSVEDNFSDMEQQQQQQHDTLYKVEELIEVDNDDVDNAEGSNIQMVEEIEPDAIVLSYHSSPPPPPRPPSSSSTKNVIRQSQRRLLGRAGKKRSVGCHHVCLNAKLIEARIAVLRAEEQRLIEETAVLRLQREKLSTENSNLTRSNQELRSNILQFKQL